jgi:hypothetical protein
MRRFVLVSVVTVLSAAATSAAEAAPTTPTLSASPRRGVALVLVTPAGPTKGASRSELFALLAERFDRHTDCALRLVDAPETSSCQGRLECLFDAARPAIDGDPNTSGLMLIVSKLRAASGTERIAGMLIDARRASPKDVESAIVARRSAKVVEDLRAEVDALVNQDLRPVLEGLGRWRSFGSLVVTAAEPVELSIDGRTLGTIPAGTTHVTEVALGAREVVASARERLPFAARVDVAEGAAAAVAVPRLAAVPPDASLSRAVTQYAGLGVVGAAVVFGIVGGIAGNGSEACFASNAVSRCDAGITYRRLGGVPVLPLSAALTVAGGAAAGGVYLEAETRPPWVSIAVGLVAGAATFVAFALAE